MLPDKEWNLYPVITLTHVRWPSSFVWLSPCHRISSLSYIKNYFLKGKVYYWENYQFFLGNRQNWSKWVAIIIFKDFPDGFAGKDFAGNAEEAGVVGSIPGLGRCLRGRNGNPLQYYWEIQVWSLGREDPLEKETAAHSSILAWKIPRMKPGRLQSMGSQRVWHDWATSVYSNQYASSAYSMHLNSAVCPNSSFLQHRNHIPSIGSDFRLVVSCYLLYHN